MGTLDGTEGHSAADRGGAECVARRKQDCASSASLRSPRRDILGPLKFLMKYEKIVTLEGSSEKPEGEG